MAHEYQGPQTPSTASGTKRALACERVHGGWLWILECGHNIKRNVPAYEEARAVCTLCATMGHEPYETKKD